MRTIKFRAWFENVKKMIHFENPEICSNEEGQWGMFLKSKEGKVYMGQGIEMQYTGLKDKNGKEIYEGDILTCRMADEKEIMEGANVNEIGVMSWMPFACFEFLTNNENYGMNECLIAGVFDGEIIGNIYENPELIK